MDSGDEIFITQSSFSKDDTEDYDADGAFDAAPQLIDPLSFQLYYYVLSVTKKSK